MTVSDNDFRIEFGYKFLAKTLYLPLDDAEINDDFGFNVKVNLINVINKHFVN